ncbi:hypothetical protein EDD11_006740 [Mortierella claussenii]|nr:hypothetical protein EDD11_006740 [Mortierella claussenii]
MTLWYRSNYLAEEALSIAKVHLDNASKAKSPKQAVMFCKKAKRALRRINFSAVTTDQAQLEQIIVAFREHGRALEKWNLNDKAQRSYNKARKLEAQVIPGALVSSATPVSAQSAASVKSTAASNEDDTPVPSSTLSTSQPEPPTPASITISIQSLSILPASMFANDYYPQAFHGKLPEPDERLSSTPQLAYCLGLLQASAMSEDDLDTPTRTWLHAMNTNDVERERLKTMATDLLREFTRDELKDANATAEVVCVAPVLDKDKFRILLKLFVDNLSAPGLLDTHALEGLDEVVKSAPAGSIDSDDLVKILQHLNVCLQSTHVQSLDHMYRLTQVVSHVLDAMADGDVRGLDREKLNAPLSTYLQALQKSADPYMVFQAAYASQALLYVPDNEERWQATLRRARAVTKGVTGLVSAAKGLNVTEFIEGLGNIQEGLEGAGQALGLVVDAYKDVTELMESGQGLKESLKEGLSFSRKRKWYPLLRAADTLLRNGELTKFEDLVCDAPCRGDVAFQWGVCQRLGRVAADPLWDDDTRRGAIAFLGEIYRNDAAWGQAAQVKQCILDILMQLATGSGGAKQAAEAMLQDLEEHGDATKRALYQACRQRGPSSHPWKVVLPPLTMSPLLDLVQKKAEIGPELRRFQRLRLQDRGKAVYIPPQAKASRQARDDNLFDLTDNVKDFLRSDQKVLLLMGDSGAGKSTFNRELEWMLWDEYDKHRDRIPIFVSLPAMEKPEKHIIAKQLREYDFTEVQIRELKDYHKFVLICDGYDECQSTGNLYNSNQLNQPGMWKAQMVISCRSEHLSHDYQSRFQPEEPRGRRMGGALLREAVIAPFSESKIRDYIEKYIERYASLLTPVWSVETYLNTIEQIPGLQGLVKNPFLLALTLEVLPDMVGLEGNLSSVRMTRVALYDKYVDNWVKKRGEERLVKRKLSGDEKKVFRILLDDSFKQSAIGFMKDLAVAIFENQGGAPVVDYPPLRDTEKWQHAFFSQADDHMNLLREACPVIRIGKGNQYRFIHQSLLEYGLARAVFEPRAEGEHGEGGEGAVAPAGQKRHREAAQEAMCTMLALDANSPLYRKSFVNKPSVLQFLAERVQQEPIFEKELRAFIEQSKVDKAWSVAAANAMTILVRAGIRFNGADLRDISIPGADLSGGEFDHAQLQGADLSNTTLRNIWLREANLSNARMEGVVFGELPYVMEEGKINCCAYSPDGKACVFGLADGKIKVYDTLTWTVTLVYEGHAGSVNSVAYSPSGQQIASGSSDETVQLWDVQSGGLVRTLDDHTDAVTSVAYSPSGQQIASGSDDDTVRLWDVQSGELVRTLGGIVPCAAYSPSIASDSDDDTWDVWSGAPTDMLIGHTDSVMGVVYSPSGQQIASGSWDNTVLLWDVQSGELGNVLDLHTDFVYSVAYSPSGQQIASCSADKTVRLWNAKSGALTHILVGHTDCVYSVAYSPSGQQIASGSWDNTVRLWDAQSGKLDHILSGHTDSVNSVAYSPSGQQIASCSADKTVRLWDAQSSASGHILSDHTHIVYSVAYSPTGQQIASGSNDNKVRLWDAQSGALGRILSGHTDSVNSVAFSPNSQQIASGSFDGTVWLWDAQSGKRVHTLNVYSGAANSVAYSPSGQQIASGSDDDRVQLWDVQSGKFSHALDDQDYIQDLPSGQQIASDSDDDMVQLWDAQSSELSHILSDHPDFVYSVAYSPSGQQIASGSLDNTVQLWDAQSGKLGLILIGHTSGVISVAYSPSGQQIASGSKDTTVRLWDAQSGVLGHTLNGHTNDVTSVAYSPKGQQIASGSEDTTVRLWDVESIQCVAVVKGCHGPIYSIAWNPTLNGTYFATGCGDRSVRMWQVLEDEDHYDVHLCWSTMNGGLALAGTSIQNVQGLSPTNKQLLEQRGAMEMPTLL